MFNVVHTDEAWFYLIVHGQKIRVFPVEDMPGAPELQHKSHVPKVTLHVFVVANGRPNPDKNFDGMVEIGRVCVKEAKRTSKNRNRGEEYECDVAIEAEWYRTWYTTHLSPAIRHKMPWMRGGSVSVQQDAATPHTGKGNLERLSEEENRQGFHIKLGTQPAQSTDLHINDLGLFRYLKTRVMGARYDAVQELVGGVFKEYEEYDAKVMERVWQSLFKVYNSVLVAKGSNDFSLHSGIKVAQKAGKLTKRVKIDREAFSKAMKFLTDVDSDGTVDSS
ncbi:unnamed protein product [Discosporangium mesarthrocarpum]